MTYLNQLIDKYKRIRSTKALTDVYTQSYALVGLGNHCIENLLPVIRHLQLPLKYICCTSERKAELITRKYKGVKGTTTLQDILNDDAIAGVFVAAHPRAHFSLASEVIKARKALFIEKPPCENTTQLLSLIDKTKLYGNKPIVVGLQRRFAPVTRILQKRLKRERVYHYHYRYLTGLYPEGDALLDLFIHPIDYVSFLFGKATIKGLESVNQKHGGQTLFLLLEHDGVKGMLELSTAYTWADAQEWFTVNTDKGSYVLKNMESLDYTPVATSWLGVPLEKVFNQTPSTFRLYGQNGFIPTLHNNSIFTQGFFSEIKTFADSVENKQPYTPLCGFESMCNTYMLLDEIKL